VDAGRQAQPGQQGTASRIVAVAGEGGDDLLRRPEKVPGTCEKIEFRLVIHNVNY